MIRWKGVLVILLVIVMGILLSLLLTDRWLERRLEANFSALIGAKVEFDGVHYSLRKMELQWQRLQVTNPDNTMQNMLETANCKLDLAVEPLLFRKVMIEEMTIEGLRFNTPRETDGYLPPEQRRKAELPWVVTTVENYLKKEKIALPVFDLNFLTRKINVDSIYAMVNLQAPDRVDSLTRVAELRFSTWENRFAALPRENDLAELESQINSLQPNNIKTVTALKDALSTVKQLREKVTKYRNTVNSVRTEFSTDIKTIRSLPSEIPSWVQQDYQRALKLARIPDINVKNVSRLIFGKQIMDRIEKVVRYTGLARSVLTRYQSAVVPRESPPRLKGQDIPFGKPHTFPDFWLKKAVISGEGPNSLLVEGNLTNLVTNQKLTGEPTRLILKGLRKDRFSLNFEATLNYLTEHPEERIKITLKNTPLKGVTLTEFALLPSTLKSGVGDVSGAFQCTDSSFSATVDMLVDKVEFQEEANEKKLSPRIKEIRRRLIQAIGKIQLQARMEQQKGQGKFILHSNLDNLISKELKSIISGEVQTATRALKTRIENAVNKPTEELKALISQKDRQLNRRLESIQTKLELFEKRLNEKKKQIEERIKKETGNKLKNLFKRP